MKYKCIIFDCDGVLVDSEIITAKVLLSMAQNLGLSIDLDFVIHEFLGKSLNDIMEFLRLRLGRLPSNFEQEYRKRTFAMFERELKPIEGVRELLDKIDIPHCVASSGPLEKIQHNLTVTGLIDKFNGRMFSCYEINSWKPNPDIFLHAAKTMGYQPSECAVVEDSLAGIQAATAGDFDTFRYIKNDNENLYQNVDYTIFSDMSQLYELLVNDKALGRLP